jgi:hypothetical protein
MLTFFNLFEKKCATSYLTKSKSEKVTILQGGEIYEAKSEFLKIMGQNR